MYRDNIIFDTAFIKTASSITYMLINDQLSDSHWGKNYSDLMMTNSSLCFRKNALTTFSLVTPLMKIYSQALPLFKRSKPRVD